MTKNLIVKKKVKELFIAEGLQINEEALSMFERDIYLKIETMARFVKNGNFKRITANTYHLAKGIYNR